MKASIFAVQSERRDSVIVSHMCFDGKVHFTSRKTEDREPLYSSFQLCDVSCRDANHFADQELPEGVQTIIRAFMIARQIS